jgi:Ohr subfamily peroxiredoxin
MTTKLDKLLYTAHTHTTGGRDGSGRSSDGALDVRLSPPGSGKPGTNPEQLLGVGWSACFIGAMGLAAKSLGLKMPQDAAVEANVSLGMTDAGAYGLAATLSITLPGLTAGQKQQLVDTAHDTCPYSKALKGNIEITLQIA